MKVDQIETFKIINGISMLDSFSIFLSKLEIFCLDKFQKLSQSTNWIFLEIE